MGKPRPPLRRADRRQTWRLRHPTTARDLRHHRYRRLSMKRPTVIALILLVACAGGTALTAQAAAPTASRRAGQLKSRLRNLVVAQEQFWAGHGTYTTDVSALGIFNSP